MKFSIITVCYNSKDTILTAIQSVLTQSYADIEYILVDGNSKDGTKDILANEAAKNPDKIKFISEPDKGIYDAMNKGLAMATGDVIGFLNSDDLFENNFIISDYAHFFAVKNVDAVFADLVYVDREDLSKVERKWRSGPLPKHGMKRGWHPAHPTFYAKSAVYKKFGVFDTTFRIASDYEIMLRFIERHKITCAYMPTSVVRMRSGGVSNRSISNVLSANLECMKAWTRNQIRCNPFLIPLKIGRKIAQLQ